MCVCVWVGVIQSSTVLVPKVGMGMVCLGTEIGHIPRSISP